MAIRFRQFVVLIVVLLIAVQAHAQGYIVPDGVTYSSAGSTAVIQIMRSPSDPASIRFALRPEFKTLPDVYYTLFSYSDYSQGEGLRVFLVSPDEPITVHGLQAHSFVELSESNLYGFDLDVPFHLGFYASSRKGGLPGIDDSPVFGWGEFVNHEGVIQMLDSALVAGGDGIYAGTQRIITIPEPGVPGFVSFAALLFGFASKRRK